MKNTPKPKSFEIVKLTSGTHRQWWDLKYRLTPGEFASETDSQTFSVTDSKTVRYVRLELGALPPDAPAPGASRILRSFAILAEHLTAKQVFTERQNAVGIVGWAALLEPDPAGELPDPRLEEGALRQVPV